jgi:hypothetical protein
VKLRSSRATDNELMARDKGSPFDTLPAWKWTGAEALGFVDALNDRSLQVLQEAAARGSETFDVVSAFPELWLKLDESARHRAAKCPFLLVVMRFDNVKWWRELKGASTTEGQGTAPQASFPKETARELCAEVLTLAWHTARSDPRVAAQVLGVSPAVASIIASLSPRDVQRIALRQSHELRPRWENNPGFWQQLLLTAITGNEASLSDFHLHGLQLLGADLLGDASPSSERPPG